MSSRVGADVRASAADPVLGVFAGGQARRMGGRDKASLPAPEGGRTLAERWVAVGTAVGLEVVFVGGTAWEGVAVLADEPPHVGPLGGLGPLLAFAGDRPAVAVACDMPHVPSSLLARLIRQEARAHPEVAVVAPRDAASGKWQPLFACYRPARAAPALAAALAAGERSFQRLFSRLDVAELPLTSEEWPLLRDWDRPEDIGR